MKSHPCSCVSVEPMQASLICTPRALALSQARLWHPRGASPHSGTAQLPPSTARWLSSYTTACHDRGTLPDTWCLAKTRAHLPVCNSDTETWSWLQLWISFEENASTTALFHTPYPGNDKAEFSAFLRLTRFEFIPPRILEGTWICRLTWVERCLHICSSWIFVQPGMQNSWHSKEEQQKSPILYLWIKRTVYPDVFTGCCVHILPYISSEGKKSCRKKEKGFFFSWLGT